MDVIVLLAQVVLAIGLFFIVNWLGDKTVSYGYIGLSVFEAKDSFPAYNFIFRVLSPIIYLIIVSAVLYYASLDFLVKNIYLVSIYYVLIRLIFYFLANRILLINWYKFVTQSIVIILSSILLYHNIIKEKKNLLPDFQTFSNELWIIVVIFLYSVFNKLTFSNERSEQRRLDYLKSRYYFFKNKYEDYFRNIADIKLKNLIYSIMIYEDFNRPKLVRIFENLNFKFSKKSHTLGVMQVQTLNFINDEESVKLGIDKIVKKHQIICDEDNSKRFTLEKLGKILEDYNSGQDYGNQVFEVYRTLMWDVLKAKEIFDVEKKIVNTNDEKKL